MTNNLTSKIAALVLVSFFAGSAAFAATETAKVEVSKDQTALKTAQDETAAPQTGEEEVEEVVVEETAN